MITKRFTYLCIFILLILFHYEVIQAADCDPCEPYAEVSLTNKGLSKIVESSLIKNFAQIKSTIRDRSGFRDITFDRSSCQTTTVGAAFRRGSENSKKAEEIEARASQRRAYRLAQVGGEGGLAFSETSIAGHSDEDYTAEEKAELERQKAICIGAPDIDHEGWVSASTALRPFKAGITDLKLNELDLKLATPLKCENLRCKFTVLVKKIDITGNFQADFTDKPDQLFPKTQLRISNTPDAEMSVEAEAFIDPTTGKLDHLVFLQSDKTKINIASGSLRFDADVVKPYASQEAEAALKAKHFREQISKVQSKLKSPKYIKDQIQRFLDETNVSQRIENDETYEQTKKRIDARIKEHFGSMDKLRERVRQINWPDFSDDKAVLAFMQDPPLELGFLPDVLRSIDTASFRADAENAGFTNPQVYNFARAALTIGNSQAGNTFLTDEIIQPLLQKEMAPIIEQEVNRELRNLNSYWQNLSKIPSLNLQNLATLGQLKENYAAAKTDEDKLRIAEEIDRLEYTMAHDWLPIETGIVFDQNTREQKILRAQITNTKPECSNYPRKFSEDTDDDFDLRTELGVPAVQEYFNKMSENNKLDLCVDSPDPVSCKGGTKIKFNQVPKISCQNGQLVADLDAEAKRKLFGITIDPDVEGQIKAEVDNCDGKICFKFTDSKGNFKRAILGGFDSIVDKALSGVLQKTSKTPIPIPYVSLKKHQINPSNCSTKLDWEIKGEN